MFSFKNHVKNQSGRLVPYLFLFFKKALNEVKASGSPQPGITEKICIKP